MQCSAWWDWSIVWLIVWRFAVVRENSLMIDGWMGKAEWSIEADKSGHQTACIHVLAAAGES